MTWTDQVSHHISLNLRWIFFRVWSILSNKHTVLHTAWKFEKFFEGTGSSKLLCALNIDIGWKLIVISSIPNHNHHNRTIFLLNWTVIGKLFCGYFFRNFFSLMIWFDCFVNHLDCNVLLYNKNTFKFIVMMLLPLKVYIQAFCQNIATGETSQAITPFHIFDNFNFHL